MNEDRRKDIGGDDILYGFSQCFTCAHYDKNKSSCPAFDEIPEEIKNNKLQHNEILKSQKKLLKYEPIKI